MTVLEELVRALNKAAATHSGEEAPPAAVLWTDKKGCWESVIPKLRDKLPSLLSFGPYDPASKTGPAIWIRCVIAGTLDWKPDGPPVVYLPGTARAELRNAEDCPRERQPLVELQYRGTLWSHSKGKDWTPAAFLASLGLEVAGDQATRSAIQARLPRILDFDADELRSLGRLDAVKINGLGSDWPTSILAWLENPAERNDDWDSFQTACKTQYGFDPQSDGKLAAGELLAEARGNWTAVWSRFANAPKRYPRTTEILRQTKPPGALDRDEGYPSKNSEAEKRLHGELSRAAKKDEVTARKRILELEREHGPRRKWVWCELGEAPLASSLQHLAECASATERPLNAAALTEMLDRFTEQGWQADQAAWQAYAAVGVNHTKLIASLLKKIYLPWLQAAGENFARLCAETPLRSVWSQLPLPTAGECLLFADGLRYDVAKLLEIELTGLGSTVEIGHRVSGLPSVTPTAKPATSPISDKFNGTETGVDFRPAVAASGKPLTSDRFRDLLKEMGIQPFDQEETGEPDGMGWTEAGALDRLGHKEGARLAKRIPEEVSDLALRVKALLDAGWKTVKIVTDHGWLWMPGGLLKAELPEHLTQSRWGRCAALKDTATTDLHTVPWHYNSNVAIALAPGISCFRAGTEYTHGGLSPQECVTPVLTVRRTSDIANAAIESVSWRGLRCKVKASGCEGLRADIRTKPADENSTVLFESKALDEDGQAVLYANDEYQDAAGVVVLVDSKGTVVAKKPTAVGGTE